MKLKTHFFLLLLVNLSCNKEIFEVILIPRGFEGRAYIVYNEPKGTEPVYKRDTIYFSIPPSGILVTKSPLGENVNLLHSRYYFSDNMEPINKSNSIDSINPCHICIYNDGITGVTPNINRYPINYRMIYIGIPKDDLAFSGVCDTSVLLKSLNY